MACTDGAMGRLGGWEGGGGAPGRPGAGHMGGMRVGGIRNAAARRTEAFREVVFATAALKATLCGLAAKEVLRKADIAAAEFRCDFSRLHSWALQDPRTRSKLQNGDPPEVPSDERPPEGGPAPSAREAARPSPSCPTSRAPGTVQRIP